MEDVVFEPLADALREIAEIAGRSESDPDAMLQMLHRIGDCVEDGKHAYMTAIRHTQEGELRELRRQARERGLAGY